MGVCETQKARRAEQRGRIQEALSSVDMLTHRKYLWVLHFKAILNDVFIYFHHILKYFKKFLMFVCVTHLALVVYVVDNLNKTLK